MSQPIDLYDTSHCPRGHRCECCGVERPDLRVVPVTLRPVGIGCMTVCPRCNNDELLASPPITVRTAANLVADHCQHLGLTQQR